jgi:hypothetical protein
VEVIHALGDHAPEWTTALGTLVIAAFTVVLAYVTQRQSKLTERALVSTQRAFVFLEEFGTEFAQTVSQPAVRHFAIKPKWRNSGTTPSKRLTVRLNWTHFPSKKMPESFNYEYGPETTRMMLGPQSTEWSDTVTIPPDVADAAFKNKHTLFIWGRADYRDVFDSSKPHFTEWCYRIHFHMRPDNKIQTQFIAHGRYNNSD